MSVPNVDRLRDCLLNLSEPIAKRTHAAFYLRTNGSQEAVDAVAEALQQKQDCPLMRHELAYILGQMQNKSVSAVLASVLDDETDDVLVRHESAEALGALGEETFLDLLIKHSTNEHVEIAETCQIAVDLIKWKNKAESVCDKKLYLSVDPAPPTNEKKTIDELKIDLMNTSDSLFERYRAMFALRNMNSDEAAVALATGFSDKSALFRHEIAYVLGQMQNSAVTRGMKLYTYDTVHAFFINCNCLQ